MIHRDTGRMAVRIGASLLSALVLLALAAPQLWYPLGFDQAVYAACGNVIRHGGVPIRDCFETKQMGVMLMYAIPMALTTSATHAVAIHGFTLIWTAITAGVIGCVGAALFGRRSGSVAGVLYWLIYAGIHYWSMDQAETFANMFLVLAFYGLWRSARDSLSTNRRVPWVLLAGLCIGCAVWFKYIFGLIGVVLGICILGWMWMRERRHPPRPITPHAWIPPLRFGLVYALGTLIPIALGVGYYALHPGGLEALAQQWRFLQDNFPLTAPLPPDGIARMLLRFLDNGADLTADFKATVPQWVVLGGGFPFIFGLAAIGFARQFNSQRAVMLTLIATMASAVFLVAWQGNYVQYHFTIVLPPLVLLAGAALAIPTHTSRYSRAIQMTRVALTLATVVLLALRMVPWVSDAYTNVVVQRKTLEQLYGESRQAAHLEAAAYLDEHTQPADSIAIFGDAPWVYVLAGRPNATRFPFINIWIKKRGTAQYDLMTKQFLEGLQQHRPAYVVIPQDNFPWPDNSAIADYKYARPIFDDVEANYQYEAEIGPFLMYRRR